MAKKRGVHGWHSMRKDQLVRALLRLSRTSGPTSKSRTAASAAKRAPAKAKKPLLRATASTKSQSKIAKLSTRKTCVKPATSAKKPMKKSPQVLKRLAAAKANSERSRDLSAKAAQHKPNGLAKDRLVAMVRDPFWLHVYWELTRPSIERARAALGQHWHTAKPVLRLLQVSTGTTTGTSERVLRDIPIHGGVNNWYVDVYNPPCSFQLAIGYLASDEGRFFSLCRSNVVTTPPAGASVDHNWVDVERNCEKIYSMSGGYANNGDNGPLRELFEERLRRPMGSPMVARFGGGAQNLLPKEDEFEFDVDAEMVVFGATRPDAHVTLRGEPVRLGDDGTFTVRLNMPNAREVIPVTASSRDGVEVRTVVISVDRNTKVMEPVIRDGAEK
jgi:uncharacterized protein